MILIVVRMNQNNVININYINSYNWPSEFIGNMRIYNLISVKVFKLQNTHIVNGTYDSIDQNNFKVLNVVERTE